MRKLGGCLKSVSPPLLRFDLFSSLFLTLSFKWMTTSSFNLNVEGSCFCSFLTRRFIRQEYPDADASPRERYPRFGNLYRTCKEKDRYVHPSRSHSSNPYLTQFILSIYYYTLAGRPPPTQHPWHSAPFNPYIICS
jgi:hypothetical protein